MSRTETYYDEESAVYSKKRYPVVVGNYIQFLFTRRKDIVLSLVGKVIEKTTAPRAIVEIGCADGVLLRAIEEKYPSAFSHMLGVDISHAMIDTAKQIETHPTIEYAYRENAPIENSATCVLEIGVGALVLELEDELDRAAAQLAPGGYFICTFGGRHSLAALLGNTAAQRSVLHPYRVSERAARKRFRLLESNSCGFFVPVLWRFPRMARVVQPILEYVGMVIPVLAHERVYLFQKR